jgi:hypothetical protein
MGTGRDVVALGSEHPQPQMGSSGEEVQAEGEEQGTQDALQALAPKQ